MNTNIVTLEQNKRFSQSSLWKYQQEYFAKKGVDAWAKGEVPYYVTSNSLIAYSYAQMALRYLQDGIRNGTINPDYPVYMFELGTGSGKFSYLFLRKMAEFLHHFHLDHLKFCYVMTDFTDNNLAFWKSHPAFNTFLQQGILDFALYTIGSTQDIQLINKNITLGENSCQNPIICVCNYIFDTVNHDIFRITANKIEEGLITTKTTADNMSGDNVLSLDRTQSDFTFNEITLPYYNNKVLDDILADYQHNLASGTFLVPIGALNSIDNLRRISNNRVLIITGDKGYTSMESMKDLGAPHIAFHGSLSMMVNFDFINRYIKNTGGDTLLAEDHEGMKISLLLSGDNFNNLPETKWAYYQFNTHLSTKEFLDIKNFIIKDITLLDLDNILSLLKFSYWDPDIFMSIVNRLVTILNQASPGYTRTLRKGLKTISDNCYFMKTSKNIVFEIGHIYHIIGDLSEALKYYQQSIDYYGEESPVCFNMGLCNYYTHNLEKAMHFFTRAFELNANNTAAKEWITYVEKELKDKTK